MCVVFVSYITPFRLFLDAERNYPPNGRKTVLTVNAQRGPSFELCAFDHGPVPHHAPVHRAVVLATRRHLQSGRRDRLLVVGADPRHGLDGIPDTFAVPFDDRIGTASGARARQLQRASFRGHGAGSRVNVRRAGRCQHGDLETLRMDFPAGTGGFQPTFELAVVPLVRRVRNQ